jgi:hypothetical protein
MRRYAVRRTGAGLGQRKAMRGVMQAPKAKPQALLLAVTVLVYVEVRDRGCFLGAGQLEVYR